MVTQLAAMPNIYAHTCMCKEPNIVHGIKYNNT